MDNSNDTIVRAFGSELEEKVSPCSTFKIPLSLMGFDREILLNEKYPVWPYKGGYANDREVWQQDQNPKSWMKFSCVWYSQLLAKAIGLDFLQNYLNDFEYGNCDMSGGITQAWLSSSLKISPIEQVYFLRRLLRGELPVSSHAHQMTKQLLFLEELPGGWKLFGKTGLGMQNDVGWLVGWVENDNRSYVFAYNLRHPNIEPLARVPRVKTLLTESGILSAQ